MILQFYTTRYNYWRDKNSKLQNQVFLLECYAVLIGIMLDCVWNVMAHAQKPDFIFRRNGRVHLNRRGRQFSRLLAVQVCASAEVMLDTPCSEVVWRVLATHSIRQFPLHFPSRVSLCAITFQLDSTFNYLPVKFQYLSLAAETYNKHVGVFILGWCVSPAPGLK